MKRKIFMALLAMNCFFAAPMLADDVKSVVKTTITGKGADGSTIETVVENVYVNGTLVSSTTTTTVTFNSGNQTQNGSLATQAPNP